MLAASHSSAAVCPANPRATNAHARAIAPSSAGGSQRCGGMTSATTSSSANTRNTTAIAAAAQPTATGRSSIASVPGDPSPLRLRAARHLARAPIALVLRIPHDALVHQVQHQQTDELGVVGWRLRRPSAPPRGRRGAWGAPSPRALQRARRRVQLVHDAPQLLQIGAQLCGERWVRGHAQQVHVHEPQVQAHEVLGQGRRAVAQQFPYGEPALVEPTPPLVDRGEATRARRTVELGEQRPVPQVVDHLAEPGVGSLAVGLIGDAGQPRDRLAIDRDAAVLRRQARTRPAQEHEQARVG